MLAALALVASISNPLTNPKVFPIAVWLQSPEMAGRYRDAGINLYVGLWEGPTEAQLAKLTAAGMPVICDQNEVGLNDRRGVIVGWMHGDEPDNAQALPDGKGWGPCVPPDLIVKRYMAMKAGQGSRPGPNKFGAPVLLNLGQGVANDAWVWRGNGAKLSDYETYVKGCDIVSFDVYPVAGLNDPSKLNLVPKGIDRLVNWTGGKKKIWNCLECTNISGTGKATPAQVRAEAWAAIVHGSRGLIYFVHQFKPSFNEHALLDDPEMLKAVTALNAEIQRYAEWINRWTPVRQTSAGVEKTRWVNPKAKQEWLEVSVNLSAVNADGLEPCEVRFTRPSSS